MTQVTAVVVTDGRQPETITKAVKSAQANLTGINIEYVIIDDSGDPENAAWLEETFPALRQVHHEVRRGLGQTVRSAWETALATDCQYIFHMEDDFTYAHQLSLNDLAIILSVHDELSQVSFKRQAVNEVEEAAGGFMQCDPGAYYDRGMYVEHQVFFTFNPCLIPRHVAEFVLSHDTQMLERDVTDLLIQKGYTFGVFGSIADLPKVTHIGTHRSVGYRV